VHIPVGAEHELTGIVDVLHMCAYTSPEGDKEGEPGPIPDEMADLAAEYREKLLDAVVETDEALMERYLDGQELDAHGGRGGAEGGGHERGRLPVACGVATKNLGTHALLDLLVEGVPSPAKKGSPIDADGAGIAGFVFKTVADPFAGPINLFRVLSGDGHRRHDPRQPPLEGRRSGWGRFSRSRARSTIPRPSSARATWDPSPS
jgi:elongation factor G